MQGKKSSSKNPGSIFSQAFSRQSSKTMKAKREEEKQFEQLLHNSEYIPKKSSLVDKKDYVLNRNSVANSKDQKEEGTQNTTLNQGIRVTMISSRSWGFTSNQAIRDLYAKSKEKNFE